MRNGYQPTEVLNQYGEEVLSIRGLFDTAVGGDSPILSRLKQWKIVPKLAVDVSNADASPRRFVINFTTYDEDPRSRKAVNAGENKG
ncbi:hypothetical protein SODG_002686 [Sodalis praecaptivus]